MSCMAELFTKHRIGKVILPLSYSPVKSALIIDEDMSELENVELNHHSYHTSDDGLKIEEKSHV